MSKTLNRTIIPFNIVSQVYIPPPTSLRSSFSPQVPSPLTSTSQPTHFSNHGHHQARLELFSSSSPSSSFSSPFSSPFSSSSYHDHRRRHRHHQPTFLLRPPPLATVRPVRKLESRCRTIGALSHGMGHLGALSPGPRWRRHAGRLPWLRPTSVSPILCSLRPDETWERELIFSCRQYEEEMRQRAQSQPTSTSSSSSTSTSTSPPVSNGVSVSSASSVTPTTPPRASRPRSRSPTRRPTRPRSSRSRSPGRDRSSRDEKGKGKGREEKSEREKIGEEVKERGFLRLEAAKKEREYRKKVEREKKEEEERLADFDRWAKEMEDGEDNE
jgi:hypothetical protein